MLFYLVNVSHDQIYVNMLWTTLMARSVKRKEGLASVRTPQNREGAGDNG